MNLNKHLINRLKSLMAKERILDTQKRVAIASGVSQSSINRILNGTQSATLDMVSSLAHAFRVRPDRYFFLESDEVELLNCFNSLDTNERRRCLNLLNNVVEAKKAGAVDFLLSDSLPDALKAVAMHEASKPLASKGNLFDEQQTATISTGPRKRSKKHPQAS